MWLELLSIAPVVGFLCIDRVSVGQTMFSQPIIAIPLLAAWFGQFETGLLAGCILQLYWLNSNLYGANIPANETMASLSAVGAALVLTSRVDSPSLVFWVLAFLISAPSAKWAQLLQRRLDFMNASLSERLVEKVEKGQPVHLFLDLGWSLSRSFFAHSLLAFITLSLTTLVLLSVSEFSSDSMDETLGFVKEFLLPALALAVSLTLIRRRLFLGIGLIVMIVLGTFSQVSGGL